MSTPSLNCSRGAGPSIVRNTTGTRVCGLQNNSNNPNSTLLSSCCFGSEIQDYACASYCSTEQAMGDFARCIMEASSTNSTQGMGLFCQRGVMANNTDRLGDTSGAIRAVGGGFWAKAASVAMVMSLVLGANASHVPADVMKRQSSSCSVTAGDNFTTLHNVSTAVSARFTCDTDPCPFGMPVTLEPFRNNRTIDGNSAAATEYDAFFSELEGVTGRQFPAASGLEVYHEFLGPPDQAFRLSFTPFAWCVMATTDCAGVGGEGSGNRTVQACGPQFVSDFDDVEGEDGDVIQGVISVVITD